MKLNYLIHKSLSMTCSITKKLYISILILSFNIINAYYAENILNSQNIIFAAREDYILEENNKINTNNKINKYFYKSKNIYNNIIDKLILKKIESENTNKLVVAKIVVLQEINKYFNNIIYQNPYVKKYAKDKNVIINNGYYDSEIKALFDKNKLEILENVINSSLKEEIIYNLDLIKLILSIPIRWQYNQSTFITFNNYLNILYQFCLYILLDKNELFLNKSELNDNNHDLDNLEELIIERNNNFLNYLLRKIKDLKISKKITNNLSQLIKSFKK